MLVKCKFCECRFAIGEEGLHAVPCNGENCDFGCHFELEYEKYPHGELVQLWTLYEGEGDEEE